MVFHSKCDLKSLVYVTEIYREDGSFIGKKSRDENKWLGVVTAIEFCDGDCLEELYTLHKVEIRWEWFRFLPVPCKYSSGFVYKVEDVIYSMKNNGFKFLVESRNSIRRTNPDRSLSKWFRNNCVLEELEALYSRYMSWFKT